MRKVVKKINAFEVRLRDEFGKPMFKAHGRPKSIMDELDGFLKQKGLYNGRKRRKKT